MSLSLTWSFSVHSPARGKSYTNGCVAGSPSIVSVLIAPTPASVAVHLHWNGSSVFLTSYWPLSATTATKFCVMPFGTLFGNT